MTAPCEYCGAPVADAETFFRLGVGPCCPNCTNRPLMLAIVCCVCTVAALVLGVVLYLKLK